MHILIRTEYVLQITIQKHIYIPYNIRMGWLWMIHETTYEWWGICTQIGCLLCMDFGCFFGGGMFEW